MTGPTVAEAERRLRAALEPDEVRDAAIGLIRATKSREKVEAALGALAREEVVDRLGDGDREPLRELAWSCFAHPARDRGGWIRERIVRILVGVGHPADADLYLAGCSAYQGAGALDVLQGLRAASLMGLARADPELGLAHAIRLLGEPATSRMNGEPSLAAIDVLAAAGRFLPVYQFALRQGDEFLDRGNGEVVGKALFVLAADLPVPLYDELAARVIASDDPAAGSGVAEGICSRGDPELLPLVEGLIRKSEHPELRRYAAVLLATSRDDAQRELLHRLAREAPPDRREEFVEAVELTSGPDRDALLADLRR